MHSSYADDVKYDLHVLLVAHGKDCASCKKGFRRGSSECPLSPFRNKRKAPNSKEGTLVVKEEPKKVKVEDCGEHVAVKEDGSHALEEASCTAMDEAVCIKKEKHH